MKYIKKVSPASGTKTSKPASAASSNATLTETAPGPRVAAGCVPVE